MTPEELLAIIDEAAESGATTLDLAGNDLTELPPEIGKLTKLASLDLSNNQLSELPDAIGNLTALTTLDLRENQLTELPDAIGNLTALTMLNLSWNQLTELPDAIGNLTALTTLDLSWNQLTELPDAIGNLTALTTLDLSWNQLTELPDAIANLTALTTLYLLQNQLTELPDAIANLTALTTLDLSWNQLTELLDAIAKLTALTTLYLSHNQLTELPDAIASLTALTTLYLEGNQLTELPDAIASLTALTYLNLGSNQLTELPDAIANLSVLTKLDLSYNELTELPDAIAKLIALTTLELEGNQLTELPDAIAKLTALTTLYLSHNQLTELPDAIAKLTALTTLYLLNNQLTELPDTIASLTALTTLDLKFNQLTELPDAIQQLTKLKKLDLRANPLSIPSSILGGKGWDEVGDVKEILDFYFRTQDPTETEPLYEAKLLLIGEGEAGKTSLAKKIKNENYEVPQKEDSTQGIEVIQWTFPLNDGQTFKVNLWDFGGQEIYHQTHQFFLSERSLYLLVADDRQENPNFNYWLKIVELLSNNSPVLIIKNEKNECQCQIDPGKLKGEFPHSLKDILPTNLATNRGLDQIKAEIAHHISRLPHVGQPLPKLWVRVRAALENNRNNHISQDRYLQICQQNSIKDKKDALFLSRYLHDLGVCLHFQKDKVLKNTIILKPEWATTAVYKILDDPTVKANFGQFDQSDLNRLWQETQYAEMQGELLHLMDKFKVHYEIPNRPNHYIAPHLLSIEQPSYRWTTENNLILRYQYDFMPKGMLTRFIVEMHNLIEAQTLVWKNGVILTKGRARAEIKENYHYNNGDIKIRVSGNSAKEFLTVIHHEFEKIHAKYERLKYQTLIPCNCPTCQQNQNPYSYEYDRLLKFLDRRQYEIQCYESGEPVNVRGLLDNVFLSSLEDNRLIQRHQQRESRTNLPSNSSNQPSAPKKVYISSTYSDLIDYRQAVYKALRKQRYDAIAMEDYVATGQHPPLDKCLADVADCDYYVGIFAWRYGYIPTENNPDQKSITELEYRQAEALKKPRFIFLLDPEASWLRKYIDKGENCDRIERLREELGTQKLVSFFKTPEELASLVSAAISNLK